MQKNHYVFNENIHLHNNWISTQLNWNRKMKIENKKNSWSMFSTFISFLFSYQFYIMVFFRCFLIIIKKRDVLIINLLSTIFNFKICYEIFNFDQCFENIKINLCCFFHEFRIFWNDISKCFRYDRRIYFNHCQLDTKMKNKKFLCWKWNEFF